MRTAIFIMLSLFASLTQATPGGLDANGCHRAKTQDFHCHEARDKHQGKTQGRGETRTQREKRLLRECRGRPNAGACLGYAKQTADPPR